MKYIPTRHRKEHNVTGTNQASFLAKFKATWPEKTPLQCSKDILRSTIYYKIQITI